jgi:hypothetical protein
VSANNNDSKLRRAFADLRQLDKRSTPEFDALLRRPSRRSVSRMRSGMAMLATSLVVVLVLVVIARRPSRDVSTPMQSISEWRAPTDVLLRTPGVEIIQSMPSLRSSVIDELGSQVNFPLQEER